MKKLIWQSQIVISFLVILLLDSIYIMLLSKNMFNNMMRAIQGTNIKPKYLAIIITYVFIFISYYYFIILKHGSIKDAFILGITTYGIYEFTNYSLFNKWNPTIVIIDTLWGGILFSLTRFITKGFY